MKILIADNLHESAKQSLEDVGHEVEVGTKCTSDNLHEFLEGVEVLVVRSTKVNQESIESAESLELIIRAGAGVDAIDVQAASRQGIYVCNVPGKNAVAVAELTFALLLSIDRHIADGVEDLRNGLWNKKLYSQADGILGKTIGIVGLGEIGLCVAERARAFGMTVLGQRKQNRTGKAEQRIRQIGVRLVDTLPELISKSDIVTIHVPYNSETESLINEELLSYFKDEAILINTSRGEVVDERALINAITEKKLRVGTDVFRNEPGAGEKKFDSELARHKSVVGSHHIGASTTQASVAIAQGVFDVISSFEQGNPNNCVNESPSGDGTSQVRVRHLDKVGVLASVLATLRASDLNVQYMNNKVFADKKAAVSTIEVVGEIPTNLYDQLVSLDNVLGVSLLDKRNEG
ncbi:MAG: NAD(P)-dependent oxidoreductase [Acidimicrobiales bacterium]|jgi:D-3-phosphoglycerate dehydrogenase|nr:NAD(P)-dependent oxidoreductase [Acidimicrobiales bacterium]MDP6297853.1 NAD(P)-dependent oxidoreductase [Acidimicrobiales bacterium]HJM27968.1 NAD(P)-dependent oxidoreductase [Acidimicrobiales bacterium]HJM96881.1 NAD(P)-dependent oxidoreductase [Acidimicrobiales bacterium]